MTRKITFLHTADLHIGAPMRGFCNLTDAWAARLRRAILESYDRMIDAAIARRVDFAVFAGDMFDTARASYGDYLRFFEGLERLEAAGIPSYLVTGNHDPYTAWQYDLTKLPESAHMMGYDGPGFELYERDGQPFCLIGARGYRNQAWPIDEPIAAGITRNAAVQELRGAHPDAAGAPFAIGIIHTGLDLDQSKAYSDPQVLLGADVDYWACGHLHKRLVRPAQPNPRIVFPGCIQGRDLKESGERGCYLVTMEKPDGMSRPQIDLEFLPTASVVFHSLNVNVSACQTLADVARLIQAQLFRENGKAGCDEMVVRVVLEGATQLHAFLRKPEVIRDLRKRINNAYPSFYCDTLLDATTAPLGPSGRRAEGAFAAQAQRVAEEQLGHPDEMVNFIQAELVKRGIDIPASLPARIDDFGRAAETLIFDLLDEEGER